MTVPTSPTRPVLLVDDEPEFLQSVSITLRVAGFEVLTCSRSGDAPDLLARHKPSAVLLDIMMPGVSGKDLLPDMAKNHPDIPIIMSTAVNDLETAVACMRAGAFDYLVKPVEKTRLLTTIRRALEYADMRAENARLRKCFFDGRLEHPEAFEHIITRDKRMLACFQYIEAIAQTPMPVLITGETGTGKEMIANAIHRASGRTGEFVSVNIAGLSDALFSDVLFGHAKGAFTGADAKREGLASKAAGGTLFLDEIGDLALESQVKLLRLLDDRSYYPVGSDAVRSCTARIVVATNRDLDSMRQSSSFRNDLFYRLQGHFVELPALRDRPDDIPLLIDAFVEEASILSAKPAPEVSPELHALLRGYAHPGNVRELRALIIDAVAVDRSGVLGTDLVSQRLRADPARVEPASDGGCGEFIRQTAQLPTLKEAEALLIEEALRRSNDNQTLAAQLLGMTRTALNKRLTRGRQSDRPSEGPNAEDPPQ